MILLFVPFSIPLNFLADFLNSVEMWSFSKYVFRTEAKGVRGEGVVKCDSPIRSVL